ncbi:hypothetical protein K431DRAFT_285492 [Polychaeton citri CBS 116435]|uniref:CCZ1/INTU/HSP4 first Longin domain-containing protein n=1 Tax=Polychaeton citri CBS 116435 TaxID=1314669 RepID=A0A9P4Q7R7_9PEZI|nr:hypothetical protein K431DRAFT_285492 [Polychaeton citri CBS 116435]
MSLQKLHESIIPAHLSFLAIYNPSVGPTDETFRDQLVFYYSRDQYEAHRKGASPVGENEAREEENEKLRQIGLAQGMIEFGRTFSDGDAVDYAETEKARILMHEIEKGWWIVASIKLTQLPKAPTSLNVNANSSSSNNEPDKEDASPAVEYSSREVSPSPLLLQQVLQAHYVFGLHHGPSLSDLYVRMSREKFCGILERYWLRFCKTWDVLLHGSPAVEAFSAIKLAASGELGIGVGEEEHGSGERAVLEDLVQRTDGLVDVIVSKFGDQATSMTNAPNDTTSKRSKPLQDWIGGGKLPAVADGVVFAGSSERVSRSSVRNVSLWLQHIYTYGDRAFAVRDNPHRERRRRRRPDQSRSNKGDMNAAHQLAHQARQENMGYFLVGLTGDLEELQEDAEITDSSLQDQTGGPRTILRTLQVEVKPQDQLDTPGSGNASSNPFDDVSYESTGSKTWRRLRVLIYARRPFVYCFLFEQRTSSLAYAGFYKQLHNTLAPIHKPLLRSTKPQPHTPQQQNYTICHDLQQLTVHSTLPDIPDPAGPRTSPTSSSPTTSWTRLDALNAHHQVINCLISIRRNELERATKSNRGWWVQWTAIPRSSSTQEETDDALDLQRGTKTEEKIADRIQLKIWKGSDPKGLSTDAPSRVTTNNLMGWIPWFGKESARGAE